MVPSHSLLFGLRTPFVIQPLGSVDISMILGDAYVYGIMDGEAFDMSEPAECEFRFI